MKNLSKMLSIMQRHTLAARDRGANVYARCHLDKGIAYNECPHCRAAQEMAAELTRVWHFLVELERLVEYGKDS